MRALIVVLAGLLLTGCAAVPGAPAHTTLSEQTAPPVVNPKDARGIKPCTLLTATQTAALAVNPAGAEAGSTADLMDCSWPSTQPPISSIAVTVDANPARRGLTDTYLKRTEFEIFEPLVVEGYPAVRAERVPNDGCVIYVGLSDTQRIRVDVFARSPADTCGLVKRVIAAVLTNLPAQK